MEQVLLPLNDTVSLRREKLTYITHWYWYICESVDYLEGVNLIIGFQLKINRPQNSVVWIESGVRWRIELQEVARTCLPPA